LQTASTARVPQRSSGVHLWCDDALAWLRARESAELMFGAGLRAVGASRTASIISYIRLSSAFQRRLCA